jgi:hypothetical protein
MAPQVFRGTLLTEYADNLDVIRHRVGGRCQIVNELIRFHIPPMSFKVGGTVSAMQTCKHIVLAASAFSPTAKCWSSLAPMVRLWFGRRHNHEPGLSDGCSVPSATHAPEGQGLPKDLDPERCGVGGMDCVGFSPAPALMRLRTQTVNFGPGGPVMTM